MPTPVALVELHGAEQISRKSLYGIWEIGGSRYSDRRFK